MAETPEIGPGDGYSLFDELESWEFWPDHPGDDNPGIIECDYDSLKEVANALWMSSPFRWQPLRDPFSFLASSSISGAGNPCFHPRCRFARAQSLARFAALYAETVLIRNPFDAVLHEEDSAKLRWEFSYALRVLHVLRPEIEAGLVAFAPTDFPLCKDDLEEFRRAEDAFRSKVFAANNELIADVLQHLDVRVRSNRDSAYLSIEGTNRYIPHEGIDVVSLDGQSRWEKGQEPTPDEVRHAVQTWVLDPALIDLQYRELINRRYNVRYLTDRPIDADLLYILDSFEEPRRPWLASRVSHVLPFIDGLDTETLLKLRREEGEAFRVYRDRVRALVDEGFLSDRDFDEAFRELVEPELNRIDKAVASVRKMAKREIREKLVFGTGAVMMGLAAGSVTPAVGAIVSAVGGAKFGMELLSSLNTLISEPAAARQNDFFFLWKARSLAPKE